jgi:hypothetical protein
LNHFSFGSSDIENEDIPPLSLRGLSSTTCFSSTLTKLCITLLSFEDCLSLLDGRLKQLSTFIVISQVVGYSLTVNNSVSYIVFYQIFEV